MIKKHSAILAVVIVTLMTVPTASATLGLASDAQVAAASPGQDSVTVDIIPENKTTEPNETVTYSVLLSNATNGVGAFDNITVSVNDTSVGEIASISTDVSAGANSGVASDGSSAYVNVPFGGDTNQTGEIELAVIDVTANESGVATVDLGVTGNIADEEGELYSINEVNNGELIVEQPVRPIAVKLQPPKQTMAANSHGRLDIVVVNATEGVGAFDTLTIELDNASVARVSNVSTTIGANTNTEISADGSTASIGLPFGGDTSKQGDVTVGTIRLNGSAVGQTEVSLSTSGDIVDTNGIQYEITTVEAGTVNVTTPPTDPVIEDGDTPTNPDDDAQFEDINGNGELDIGDVQALFQNKDNEELTAYEGLFDWNGNGQIDIGDVQALFDEI